MASRERARTWRKSSYSDAQGNGDCVEIACNHGERAVRDSKSGAGGGSLWFPTAVWNVFLRTAGDTR